MIERPKCDCQHCEYTHRHEGKILTAEEIFAPDPYVSLARSGDIRWGRWYFEPCNFTLNHDSKYQIDLLQESRVDALFASWMGHLAQKQGAFDTDDIGHLVWAFEALFGRFDGSDPIRVLDGERLRYPLVDPIPVEEVSGVCGVYCVRSGDFVKVGQATNIAARVASLQTGSPHKLEVLAVLSGDPNREAGYHARFSHLRAHGEWFKLVEQIAVVIRDARWKP